MKSGMLFTKKMSFFWLLMRAKSSRLAGQVAKSQEPGKKSQVVKNEKWKMNNEEWDAVYKEDEFFWLLIRAKS